MPRVLLTGAQGFLGAALVEILSNMDNIKLIKHSRNKENGFYNCNLTDKNSVSEMIENIAPDLIIHTAAFVPKTLSEYESEASEQNILMVENLLCNKNVKFINISSMTVYGSLSSEVIRSEDSILDPESKYGCSKLKVERFLLKKENPTLSIRIPGLFGVNRKSGLIYNLLNSFSTGDEFVLPDKPILWAAMSVNDAALLISKIARAFLDRSLNYSEINVGYKDIYSINRLLNICQDIFNTKVAYQVSHPEFKFCTKRLDALGAALNTTLEDALIKVKNDYGL